LGFADPSEPTVANLALSQITGEHLRASKIIFTKPFVWRKFPNLNTDTLPLPFQNLPPLLPNQPSYLIDGLVPEYPIEHAEPPPRVRSCPSRNRTSAPTFAAVDEPHASTGSGSRPFEEEVLAQLRDLRLNQDTMLQNQHSMQTYMHGLGARVDKLQDDVERMGYPWYDFAYRSHMVPRTAAVPSWFERPDESQFFDVNLSRGLGGLQIGGHRVQNTPLPAYGHVPMRFGGGESSGAGLDDLSGANPEEGADDAAFDEFDFPDPAGAQP